MILSAPPSLPIFFAVSSAISSLSCLEITCLMEDSFIISTAASAPILDASISLTALFRYFIPSSAFTFHGSIATLILGGAVFSSAIPLAVNSKQYAVSKKKRYKRQEARGKIFFLILTSCFLLLTSDFRLLTFFITSPLALKPLKS